ncbi:hypothetical protein PQX77_005923 [Marasmius sp. AFHP31]|nr:hypothetical protein PQX77_005923 [Marasmius sp. AFHP31]
MVASTPSTTIGDDRKRKITYERAKVIHLSRQLQLRLQYARLKVEHGWHKQNLNEVENLYFRHSHTKPRPSLRDLPIMTCPVTPATQQSSQTSCTTQNPSDEQKNEGDEVSQDEMQTDEAASEETSSTPQPQATVTSTITTTVPVTPEDASISPLQPSPMPLDSAQAMNTTAQESKTHHPPFSAVPQLTSAQKTAHETVPTYPITSYYGALLTSQASAAYSPRYGTLPPPSPSILASSQKFTPTQSGTVAVPSQGHPPVTATSPAIPDPFRFGTAATASLTYDSFWSSHLSSRSRAALASRSSENLSSKPSVANPLPRRTTSDIAHALSGIFTAGNPPPSVAQPGGTQHLPQPEVSSRV